MRITSRFLVFATFTLIVACQSNSARQTLDFLITSDQAAALDAIVSQIQEATGQVPRASLSEDIVSDILTGYDDDIRALLNEDQWNAYTEYQKPYWASLIFRDQVRAIERGDKHFGDLRWLLSGADKATSALPNN